MSLFLVFSHFVRVRARVVGIDPSGLQLRSIREAIRSEVTSMTDGRSVNYLGRYKTVLRRINAELELELIQSHMAQEPMLRGEVGARVRVIRACGQRRERRYGSTPRGVLALHSLSF